MDTGYYTYVKKYRVKGADPAQQDRVQKGKYTYVVIITILSSSPAFSLFFFLYLALSFCCPTLWLIGCSIGH